MSDIGFYHLTRSTLEQALPQLLGRTLAAGERAVVVCGGPERVAALDAALWACAEPNWLPHGTPADGDADLAAAIQMAKASNDNVTLPCWTALQGFVGQVKALPPPDQLPKLHLATDVEVATDLMIALQPNSPVVTQCQALANFQKVSAINMVTGIVTGALTLGKLAPIVPLVP